MTTFKAAALQMGPASATLDETVGRILSLMGAAAEQGAEIAVLPELALSPYFAAKVQDISEWDDVRSVTAAMGRIGQKARETELAIVVSHQEPTKNGLYNSMSFLGPDGATKGVFRKVHIPGQLDPDPEKEITILEKRYFQPGDLGFPAYPLELRGGARCAAGGLICYDRRFPESWRSLLLNGAELFCCSYNTPVMNGGTLEAARHASQLAITGGAYSNATWTIACGKAGEENGTTFIGASFICGPDGVIVAQAATMGDEVVLAEVDMAQQTKIRDRWAFIENRMPGSYRLDRAAAAETRGAA
ncbi:nitrilase-related carbon-nitrogen hydrolase [Thioclava kandeliae]|uniref:Nitrilase-related carbon-nitrogen hydrolase n=1 Tax=Thioclava kandeliae TaxID=3070818 RepID=A0ABV1SEP1_9RHOB